MIKTGLPLYEWQTCNSQLNCAVFLSLELFLSIYVMMRQYYQKICCFSLLLIVISAAVSCRSRSEPLETIRLENIIINLSAAKNINSDERNVEKPVQLMFFQLKRLEPFEKEDFFTLTNSENKPDEQASRKIDDMIVQPGEKRKFNLPVEKETIAIGVIAAYRNIERARWKAVYRLPEPPAKTWYQKLWPGSSQALFVPEVTVDVGRLHVSIK